MEKYHSGGTIASCILGNISHYQRVLIHIHVVNGKGKCLFLRKKGRIGPRYL